MATKRQIEEQDRATEARRHDALGRIIAHVKPDDDGVFDRGVAVGVLGALADAIDGEAADVRELRRKGWQSAATSLDSAAGTVRWWLDRLVEYAPPAGMPTREPAEIARDHRADTPADLEQRLVDAFGPELAPVRHIRVMLDRHDTDQPEPYGPLCNATTGSFTHPGGANCEECHRIYADQQGQPYAGPMAFGNVPVIVDPRMPADTIAVVSDTDAAVIKIDHPPMPVEPAVPVSLKVANTSIERRDEPVTPAVGHYCGHCQQTLMKPCEVPGASVTADLAQPLHIVEPTAPAVRPRMSAAQVREHAMRRASGTEHRSISQVEGFSDCGTRYALRDLERPAWWNVGGKALHRAVEEINRSAAAEGFGPLPLDSDDAKQAAERLFLRALDAEIADQHAATPEHPMSTWRAAKRGAEHYDWWRVEGPVMVQRWVAWLSRMLADGWSIATVAGMGDLAVIEFKTYLDVGIDVPNLSIIDLALVRGARNELLIVDCKAGGSAPKDTFQLGVYGWSLLAAGVAGFTPSPDLSNVRGAYWRARTGEHFPANDPRTPIGWPILGMHPWPNVVQRYRDMDAMERQGIYMPNVSSFCGGCGVADLCPAKASA